MDSIDNFFIHINTLNPFSSLLIFIMLMAAVMLVFFGAYLLPSLIALARHHPQKWLLVGANVFFAWTGLGWIALLVWSLWPRDELMALNKRFAASGQDWGPYQDRAQSYGGTNHNDNLAQLNQLRERGVLSEDEFTKAKERLSDKS